ncbi:class I SAM-dependent methyltransferase [Neorhodopirellula pilleata]|uniref:class I SAM-dependent methyltransferase n=1 Tax=Neorhodopirellula pilleata TaxID=2714738 RepID=UPI001E378D31|nr:class I SAM-dependent methyltransferase [Neorhodopirellula pilleata]
MPDSHPSPESKSLASASLPTNRSDQTAWRRPLGVAPGTWRYVHEGRIASLYDEFVASTPLCRVDLEMLASVFPPESSSSENNPLPRHHHGGLAASESSQKSIQSPKKWIFDLGCGTGRASEVLAGNGYDVLAIDLSLPMLREVIARELPCVQPIHANLVELDAINDGIGLGAVCLFSTLGMIQGRSNRRKFLKHVRRIVQPGGRFLLHAHHRYAAMTHAAGRRQLMLSRLRSWCCRGLEFGDAVYPYRGLPDMFLHQFSKQELMSDLQTSGWKIQRWERLSLDGSQLLDRRGIAGGFLVVVE